MLQCVCYISSRAGSWYLFKVAVLAGPLLAVLVVDDVQRSLSLLHLQTLDLCLQLVQLLLQVFALLHVLHPEDIILDRLYYIIELAFCTINKYDDKGKTCLTLLNRGTNGKLL